MPKDGLNDKEWEERLRLFANEKFVFSRGRHPGKQSKWWGVMEDIKRCPRHNSSSGKNMFGAALICKCGYHVVKFV